MSVASDLFLPPSSQFLRSDYRELYKDHFRFTTEASAHSGQWIHHWYLGCMKGNGNIWSTNWYKAAWTFAPHSNVSCDKWTFFKRWHLSNKMKGIFHPYFPVLYCVYMHLSNQASQRKQLSQVVGEQSVHALRSLTYFGSMGSQIFTVTEKKCFLTSIFSCIFFFFVVFM